MEETKSTTKEAPEKKRNWAFVMYPESAPADWVERLQLTGLTAAISPLHDQDVNPTGEPKKPHWHVLLHYSGPTSYKVVAKLTASLKGTVPQAIEQMRGYYRYLTHMDNPEKHQYDAKDIKHLNGFNIADFIEMSRSEVIEVKRNLQLLIREQNIFEYADLMDYLLDNSMFIEHEVASNNTYFFDKYISSRRNRPHPKTPLVDENGEVIDI